MYAKYHGHLEKIKRKSIELWACNSEELSVIQDGGTEDGLVWSQEGGFQCDPHPRKMAQESSQLKWEGP